MHGPPHQPELMQWQALQIWSSSYLHSTDRMLALCPGWEVGSAARHLAQTGNILVMVICRLCKGCLVKTQRMYNPMQRDSMAFVRHLAPDMRMS